MTNMTIASNRFQETVEITDVLLNCLLFRKSLTAC